MQVGAAAELENWCTRGRQSLHQAELAREAAGAMQITLEVRPETLHRFMAAHAELSSWLGYPPPFGWFLSFALDASDPAELEKTLRQMGSDYLRNRRLLE